MIQPLIARWLVVEGLCGVGALEKGRYDEREPGGGIVGVSTRMEWRRRRCEGPGYCDYALYLAPLWDREGWTHKLWRNCSLTHLYGLMTELSTGAHTCSDKPVMACVHGTASQATGGKGWGQGKREESKEGAWNGGSCVILLLLSRSQDWRVEASRPLHMRHRPPALRVRAAQSVLSARGTTKEIAK